MEIKQLQTLLAIDEYKTFSAAARSLMTVQSNVSAHIARLESELGVVLVDRHRGGLTDEGELVAERARRILHEIDDIGSDMSSLGDNVAGACRLGSIGTTARWLMPKMLISLSRSHPNVAITIYEGGTSTLIPRLLEGHLDAAIVHLPVESSEVETVQLFAEDLVLLAHSSHELADHTTISIEELSRHSILLPPRGSVLRKIIDRAAANKRVEFSPLAEIDGVRLMTSLAFENFGPAIVPATAIQDGFKVILYASRCPNSLDELLDGYSVFGPVQVPPPWPSVRWHWPLSSNEQTASQASISRAAVGYLEGNHTV